MTNFFSNCFLIFRDKTGWILILLSFLISVLLWPNFPKVWGSETHINFLAFAFLISLIFVRRSAFLKGEISVLCFYLALQLLLVVSCVISANFSIGDVFSLLRPALLGIMFSGFIFVLFACKRHPADILDVFVKASFFFLLVYFCLEFTGISSSFKYLLYERDKFLPYDYFLNFFATTYFSAYFIFICFGYSFVRFLYSSSFSWMLISIVLLVFIFFAQSKSFYLSSAIFVFFAIFFRLNGFFRLVIFVCTAISVFLLSITFNFWLSLFGSVDIRSIKSMTTIISDPNMSGTLQIRLSQIYFALSASLNNYGFGAGLGRDLYLESYIASFLFRYGLWGFIFYSLFFLKIAFSSLVKFSHSKTNNDKVLFLFISLWFFLLPIGMLSSPMYEMGKNAIFSSFLLAVFIFARDASYEAKIFRKP